MSKIGKTFSAIKEIIKNPWLLNHVLNDNSVWQQKVSKKYNLPDGLPTIQLDELFPSFSEELSSFSFMGGGSLPTDIALLKSACRKFPNASYFEIGTWRGESVKNVADVAASCVTLNLSKEQMLEMGLTEQYADAHAFFSKDLPNVQHLNGDSQIFDFQGLNKKFDVAFIDGNHHFEAVVNDSKNVFHHLTHDKSIIIWHDYAFDPEHVRFEILHAILDGIPKTEHCNLYHVANTMCAIFIRDSFIAQPLKVNANPTRTFEVSLKSKKI